MARRRGRPSKYTPEEFVRAWQGSSSVEEVMQKLPGMRERALTARAYAYRKKGIMLKSMSGPGEPTDWGALAKLTKSLGGKPTPKKR